MDLNIWGKVNKENNTPFLKDKGITGSPCNTDKVISAGKEDIEAACVGKTCLNCTFKFCVLFIQ